MKRLRNDACVSPIAGSINLTAYRPALDQHCEGRGALNIDRAPNDIGMFSTAAHNGKAVWIMMDHITAGLLCSMKMTQGMPLSHGLRLATMGLNREKAHLITNLLDPMLLSIKVSKGWWCTMQTKLKLLRGATDSKRTLHQSLIRLCSSTFLDFTLGKQSGLMPKCYQRARYEAL